MLNQELENRWHQNFREQGSVMQKISDFIDHWIFTISLGAIGFSFGFVKNSENILRSDILHWSWIMFASAAFAIGVSCLLVIRICGIEQKHINETMAKGINPSNNYTSVGRKPIWKIKWFTVRNIQIFFQWAGLIIFTSAIITFLVFAISNT